MQRKPRASCGSTTDNPTPSSFTSGPMYRARLSLAFAALVALVCIQAAFVHWGVQRVNDYAQHSRLASDILSELLDLSSAKQRLRVWATQQLMNAQAEPEVRNRLLQQMHANAQALTELAQRDMALWTELATRDGMALPQEIPQLVTVTELLDDNIRAVEARLAQLQPLEPGADFAAVFAELNATFDMTRGRDLRELINGAIERQRAAVPVARNNTERGLEELSHRAIAMVLITLAVAAALALHLNRRLQRPLERLLAGTRALQAGDLNHRVPFGSHDEFDRVAQHFNAMAEELQQHRARADAARRNLEDAVAARTRELSAAHDALQGADLRRRQLFADLGHELRTPATAIRGEAEIALRGEDRPPHEYRQTLTRIVGGVDQLTQVIRDLLLVAKAEADRLVMQPRRVALAPLLADAAEQAAALGAARGVRVECSDAPTPAAESPPASVQADPDRLRQALMIVLDNAVRYSHAGGTVRITCECESDTARITVADQGIGIAPDEVPQVFERFVRGQRARAHRADGTGIGLSIALSIVQAHQGQITIERSEPGVGTEVRITLPMAPAGDAA